MTETSSQKNEGPGHQAGPFLEFAIVLGLCALALFVVIPAGTRESENFGLSPRMVPTVTVIAIALFAVIGFVSGLLKGTRRAPVGKDGLFGVAALMAATVLGVAAIHWLGLVMGGTVLVLLASLALGLRHPVTLLTMGGAAALLLALVDWSGL